MASKPTNTGLPEGFESPFTRVEMRERMDDSLACIATLTGKTLDEITTMAMGLGLPPFGPCYVTEDMIAKLLMKASGLVASKYKVCEGIDLLPDVAILLVDYDEETEVGRHVVWHHVRSTPERPSHHYIIDPAPAPWAEGVTSMVKKYKIAYYIEVAAKPTKGK